jgi:hypothetical protein
MNPCQNNQTEEERFLKRYTRKIKIQNISQQFAHPICDLAGNGE